MSNTSRSTEELKRDLKPSAADGVRTVAKTVLSILPLVGSPAAELLTAVVAEPLSRRRDEWMVYVYESLLEVQARIEGFDVNKLGENEQFVTAATNAMQSAMRTHQKEKLRALRNAVLNSALSSSLSDDVQLMYLAFIDDLTPSHLDILTFARHPKRWMEINGHPMPILHKGHQTNLYQMQHFRENALAKYRKNKSLYTVMIDDLERRGLIEGDPVNMIENAPSPQKFKLSHVTAFGSDFLAYISEPEPCVIA